MMRAGTVLGMIRRVGGGGRRRRLRLRALGYIVGPVGDALLSGHVPVVGLGGEIVLGHVFGVVGERRMIWVGGEGRVY